MKVLVAGSTGALGVPTVRALMGSGHEVVGLTRSPEKAKSLRALGAQAVLGDVLEADAMKRVMNEVRPEGVVQLLNALPKRGALRPRDLEATNHLRIEGTRNVLAASVEAGARRFVAESMILGYGYGDVGEVRIAEERPFLRDSAFEGAQPALDGLNSLEDQVRAATEAGRIEGIVLRYGLFYGPGVGSTEFMVSLLRKRLFVLPGGGQAIASWIHVEDGASAAVAALEAARGGSVYNVVDDEPMTLRDVAVCLSDTLGLPKPRTVPMWVARLGGRYAAVMATTKLPVSNDKIKAELAWEPRYPTLREGARSLVRETGQSRSSGDAAA